MGFDPERFVNLADVDDFICAICQGIYDRPMVTPCRHTYCKECIEEWIQNKNCCPLDQATVKKLNLIQAPYILQSMINKLLIHCDYHSSGCQEIVSVGALNNHLLRCTFAPTSSKVRNENNSSYGLQMDQSQESSALPVIASSIAVGLGIVGALWFKKRADKNSRNLNHESDQERISHRY